MLKCMGESLKFFHVSKITRDNRTLIPKRRFFICPYHLFIEFDAINNTINQVDFPRSVQLLTFTFVSNQLCPQSPQTEFRLVEQSKRQVTQQSKSTIKPVKLRPASCIWTISFLQFIPSKIRPSH